MANPTIHRAGHRALTALATAGFLFTLITPVFGDPPRHAPAHGWRRKHEQARYARRHSADYGRREGARRREDARRRYEEQRRWEEELRRRDRYSADTYDGRSGTGLEDLADILLGGGRGGNLSGLGDLLGGGGLGDLLGGLRARR